MRVNNQPAATAGQVQSAETSRTQQSDRAKAKENAEKAHTAATSTAIPGSVKADFSAKAKEMAQAKSVAGSSPDVREEKIAALKAKIAAGTYKVDANKVADKMFEDHAQMSAAGLG